jgi:FkbM family methyltransferase
MGLARLIAALRNVKNELFDVYAQRSYAQEGEDLILERLFERRREGFYVDVGAHHPKRFSNTQLFYRRGWRGINIEPNPQAAALFRRARPRDVNLTLAISEREGTATYHMFDESALNTLDTALAQERHRTSGYRLTGRQEIAVSPLRTVIERWLPAGGQIDFLSIDVEGHEMSVLRSADWQRHRPKVVVVEVLGARDSGLFGSEVHRFLESVGYAWFAKTASSVFYFEPGSAVALGLRS